MTEFIHKAILYFTIAILVVSLFTMRSCSAQTKQGVSTQKVIVPEKKGEFHKPVAILNGKTKKDSVVYKDKIITTENPVNKELYKKYAEAKDSLDQVKMYLEAIEEREQTQVFDNKDVKIEVYTKTRGQLLELKPKYTIKEREEQVQVKQKESVFAVHTGLVIETSTSLNKLVPKAQLGLQNKRGDILSLYYSTDKSIGVGYTFRIINIKR
jgi:hypothetical protein